MSDDIAAERRQGFYEEGAPLPPLEGEKERIPSFFPQEGLSRKLKLKDISQHLSSQQQKSELKVP